MRYFSTFSMIERFFDQKIIEVENSLAAWKENRKNYRHLQLPVHTRDKNMFCRPIKIQRFDTQTSKFTRPHLGTFWRQLRKWS